jgi:hypothetical protein
VRANTVNTEKNRDTNISIGEKGIKSFTLRL